MTSLSKQLERKRREIPWLLVVTIVLFWSSFFFNAWTWGALGRVNSAGPLIESNVRKESFLALTYMKTGHWLADLAGQAQLGTAGVEVDYAQTLPKIVVEYTVATRLVLDSKESFRARLLSWTHYATIPLFVLVDRFHHHAATYPAHLHAIDLIQTQADRSDVQTHGTLLMDLVPVAVQR